MISTDILNNNLNDRVSYYDFFSAFGYSDRDKLYLRTFKDKGEKDSGRNYDCILKNLSFFEKSLHDDNREDRGIFFVVNGGGQKDSDVKEVKAFFIDDDEASFEEQIEKLNSFDLEPSVIIKTKRSLHAYWLTKGETRIDYFTKIQEGFIEVFKSDMSIKNPSRVMRLYGFEHRKGDPVLVKLIKFDPDLRYTQKEIVEVLKKYVKRPEEKKADQVAGTMTYDWDDEVPDNETTGADLALAERNYSVKWLDRFCQDHGVTRLKRIERTDGNGDQKIITAVVCPWVDQHTDGDESGSVVIVHQSGAISYLCQHSHCLGRDWKAFRSFYEQRDGQNPRSEELTGSPTGESSTGSDQNGSQGDSGSGNSGETIDIEGLKDCVVGEFIESGEFDQAINYFTKYQNRSTGFSNIDEYLTLYPGLACLTGATSLGKTSFVVQLCDQLIEKGETVLYFTLEQLPIEIVTKSIARRVYLKDNKSRYNNILIKQGVEARIVEEAKKEYIEVSKRFHIIESDFTLTANQIVFYVESFIKKTGIKPVVVLDYLQLVSPPADRKYDDRERIDDCVKKLKLLSKNNELFVLMISNMSRASYRERIGEDSFKESGLIEYTCDYLFGLQLAILENDAFFAKEGSRGGSKETLKSEKQKLIDEASEAIPKEVVFKAMKNRNGKKTWKAFFKYRPDFDIFEVDLESEYDNDHKIERAKSLAEKLEINFRDA